MEDEKIINVDWDAIFKAQQRLFWCDVPDKSSFEFIVAHKSEKNKSYKIKGYWVNEFECISLNDVDNPNLEAWSPFMLSFPYITFVNSLRRIPVRWRIWNTELYYCMKWTKVSRKTLKIHEIRKLTEEELEKTKSALESQNSN